jgi:hypothetical protein
MRSVLKKVVEILDGTPAVYGKQERWRGQSVVELTLVTPILIVLLMGLAEIGWFANNYLILLEVTRVGARLGTLQTGETSPLEWNNDASRSPSPGWNDVPPTINGRPADDYRTCAEVRDPNNREVRGFYNLIACVMTQQMDPLAMNALNGEDDIVISAFSFYAVDPSTMNVTQSFWNGGASNYTLLKRATIPALNDLPQILVAGRYPTNANECTADANGNSRVWERDPFDFFQDNARNYQLKNVSGGDPADGSNRHYVELEGYDPPTYSPYTVLGPTQPSAVPERQRGWVLFGNHYISDTIDPVDPLRRGCIGSEWSIDEIQELMNGVAFQLAAAPKDQRARLPSQGMVMVELFWEHELLLKNPVFNPVWTILGDQTTLSVWAAFPLPTTEPRITIQ